MNYARFFEDNRKIDHAQLVGKAVRAIRITPLSKVRFGEAAMQRH